MDSFSCEIFVNKIWQLQFRFRIFVCDEKDEHGHVGVIRIGQTAKPWHTLFSSFISTPEVEIDLPHSHSR